MAGAEHSNFMSAAEEHKCAIIEKTNEAKEYEQIPLSARMTNPFDKYIAKRNRDWGGTDEGKGTPGQD